MYQAFFDGSVDRENQICTIGYIVLSPKGKVVRQYANKLPQYIDNSVMVEIQSFNELLRCIIRHNIRDIIIRSDCKHLVDHINTNSNKKPYRKSKEYVQQIPNFKLEWVPRKYNKYADMLCDLGKENKVLLSGGIAPNINSKASL
jgi:ribonuclease HI